MLCFDPAYESVADAMREVVRRFVPVSGAPNHTWRGEVWQRAVSGGGGGVLGRSAAGRVRPAGAARQLAARMSAGPLAGTGMPCGEWHHLTSLGVEGGAGGAAFEGARSQASVRCAGLGCFRTA